MKILTVLDLGVYNGEQKMLVNVFGDKKIVKVLDFLLDNLFSQFTKTDIAKGSVVSRASVSKIVSFLVDMDMLKGTKKSGKPTRFMLNTSSPSVRYLIKLDSEVSKSLVDSGISVEVNNK